MLEGWRDRGIIYLVNSGLCHGLHYKNNNVIRIKVVTILEYVRSAFLNRSSLEHQ